jgi:hypothetical protein
VHISSRRKSPPSPRSVSVRPSVRSGRASMLTSSAAWRSRAGRGKRPHSPPTGWRASRLSTRTALRSGQAGGKTVDERTSPPIPATGRAAGRRT